MGPGWKVNCSANRIVCIADFERVSVNQELNMVLLRLIEYLGYPNDLVIGAALNEVGT